MSNVQLKEMEKTGVIINTREELKWYLELCESAGWVWCTSAKAMSNFEKVSGGLPTTIAIQDRFKWALIEGSHKLLTIAAFKEEQGLNAPQPLREHDNLRVLISNTKQAQQLVSTFGCDFVTLGATEKALWGSSTHVTIYIQNRKIVGWDPDEGEAYKFPWIDYDELGGLNVNPFGCEDCGCLEQVFYSETVMACANCGQLRDKAQPIETQPSKEDTMTGTFFETKHFIQGCNVASMTVDQFLHAITEKKAQIRTLESIEIKSDVLNAQIAKQEADLALIIEKMEELHG